MADDMGKRWSSLAWQRPWLDYLLIIIAIGLAYRSSLSFRLMGDASLLIENNQQMYSISNWWQILTSDYFDASNPEQIGYWRPITKGSWLLETLIGGGAHWVYELVQVSWLALAALGVQKLAVSLGARRGWALGAALFFGLHPSLVEAACLVQARSDLVCGAGVIWSLIGWLQWRSGVKFGLLVHVIGAVTAFGSKETAAVLPLVLACWALFADTAHKPRSLRHLFHVLWPACTVLTVYLVMRWLALDRSVRGGLNLSGTHLLALAGAYAQGLLPLPLESTVRNLSPSELTSPWCMVRGALALLAFLASVGLAWRYHRFGIGLAAWASGSLLLVILPSKLNVPGAREMTALADRWLLQAVAASATALALAGSHLVTSKVLQQAVSFLAGGWALLSIALGPVLHADYKDEIALLHLEDRDYLATPEEYRSSFETCRFVERGLIRARIEGNIDQLLTLVTTLEQRQCSMKNANVTALTALAQAGDFSRARIFADRILEGKGVYGRRLRVLPWIGLVLLNTGDPRRAALVLEEARKRTIDDCFIIPMLAQARAKLGEQAVAARLLEEARHCAATRADPQLPP
ncbi:MAG TPA: hypothetical protein VHO25_01640 [Polyangiaceae bacterium]|nr:hypothetical protein [Polyangiaceae bacterium]